MYVERLVVAYEKDYLHKCVTLVCFLLHALNSFFRLSSRTKFFKYIKVKSSAIFLGIYYGANPWYLSVSAKVADKPLIC